MSAGTETPSVLPAERPPLEMIALAAWVNVDGPEKLPDVMRASTCKHTMAAWKRVADALASALATEQVAVARAEAIEEAARVADRNAKHHAEAFRVELVRKDHEKQTHYAARWREAEELATAIRNLLEKPDAGR